MAKISMLFNDTALGDVLLDKPVITVGRSKKNDIVLDDRAVSRVHARIYKEGPRFIVEDLKSLNGTFVNDKKVSQWILSDNDEILIGKHTLVFVDETDQLAGEKAVPGMQEVEEPPTRPTTQQPELHDKTHAASTGETSKEIQAGISIISGGSGQQEIHLTKRLTIAGKGDHADIKLKGLFVGRTVFLISRRPSGFTIFSSAGGPITHVNGVPVKDQQMLNDGDVISTGGNKMRFTMKT
jgi:pSer/pThr/pTyr-binding forkhead associated (FHA) protein